MSDQAELRRPDGEPFRFLIVDDSDFILKSLRVTIKLLGGDVVGEARDGVEAIDLYRKLRPDMVTCDIVMPTMTGVDVVRQLMAMDPEARVVMVSSLGHQEMVREAIGAGARYFIVKPFKPAEAAATLAQVIRKLYRL